MVNHEHPRIGDRSQKITKIQSSKSKITYHRRFSVLFNLNSETSSTTEGHPPIEIECAANPRLQERFGNHPSFQIISLPHFHGHEIARFCFTVGVVRSETVCVVGARLSVPGETERIVWNPATYIVLKVTRS